ncbi:MAG TPA: hypothetical protein DCG12_04730 [Planctomycetaceae bacterium]|nr:hypothetical protein [Planctomycetaceae bacterium]
MGTHGPDQELSFTHGDPMSRLGIIASLTLIAVLAPITAADEAEKQEHPLTPAIAYAKKCLAKVEALPGYTATFYKKEVVGRKTVNHQMRVKIRHEPFSVYLFFEKPHNGREVLYVDGENDGKLLAHEAGLLSIAGSVSLNPTDSTAMNENRYPITMSGIANIVGEVIKTWEEETRYQGTEVKYFKNAKLGDLTCRVIESNHPKPYKQFKNQKVRLWIDAKTGFPVRVQTYAFPKKAGREPALVEDYTFKDLKTDVRLTDADFDRNNKRYSF